MPATGTRNRGRKRLPASFRSLFWDYPFKEIRWETDQELITSRILSVGSWTAIGRLRKRIGDDGLRAWICRRRGAGLSARQIRFWELVLGLPHRQVNFWLKEPHRAIWDRRDRK